MVMPIYFRVFYRRFLCLSSLEMSNRNEMYEKLGVIYVLTSFCDKQKLFIRFNITAYK